MAGRPGQAVEWVCHLRQVGEACVLAAGHLGLALEWACRLHQPGGALAACCLAQPEGVFRLRLPACALKAFRPGLGVEWGARLHLLGADLLHLPVFHRFLQQGEI